MKERSIGIKQIYAMLVGRVDEVLTVLDGMEARQEYDWFHMIKVQEMLKKALLEAEEAYINAEEPKLIVLPQDRRERPK